METSNGYPGGQFNLSALCFEILSFRCRVGAEPMQLAKLPPANNYWYITVERFQNVVLGLQALTPHCILSSLHPRPPSVGVSKANAFSAPTLHCFVGFLGIALLGEIARRNICLKILPSQRSKTCGGNLKRLPRRAI